VAGSHTCRSNFVGIYDEFGRYFGVAASLDRHNRFEDATVFCLIKDQSRVTAIEYDLIAAAAIVVMGTVGANLANTFSNIASNL
jgi:Flp pilus assembly pilin Flp